MVDLSSACSEDFFLRKSRQILENFLDIPIVDNSENRTTNRDFESDIY